MRSDLLLLLRFFYYLYTSAVLYFILSCMYRLFSCTIQISFNSISFDCIYAIFLVLWASLVHFSFVLILFSFTSFHSCQFIILYVIVDLYMLLLYGLCACCPTLFVVASLLMQHERWI